MKLYTRKGDDGSTALYGGQRVAKDDSRIEAVGTVDELNSLIALADAACRFDELGRVLADLQNRLFDLGSDLATPARDEAGKEPPRAGRIRRAHADALEQAIDAACAPLPDLDRFILPGGCELSARLHAARAVCRRAERRCVDLARREPIGSDVVVYLNRLSDLLFAMARRANQLEGVEDVPWNPE